MTELTVYVYVEARAEPQMPVTTRQIAKPNIPRKRDIANSPSRSCETSNRCTLSPRLFPNYFYVTPLCFSILPIAWAGRAPAPVIPLDAVTESTTDAQPDGQFQSRRYRCWQAAGTAFPTVILRYHTK